MNYEGDPATPVGVEGLNIDEVASWLALMGQAPRNDIFLRVPDQVRDLRCATRGIIRG